MYRYVYIMVPIWITFMESILHNESFQSCHGTHVCIHVILGWTILTNIKILITLMQTNFQATLKHIVEITNLYVGHNNKIEKFRCFSQIFLKKYFQTSTTQHYGCPSISVKHKIKWGFVTCNHCLNNKTLQYIAYLWVVILSAMKVMKLNISNHRARH